MKFRSNTLLGSRTLPEPPKAPVQCRYHLFRLKIPRTGDNDVFCPVIFLDMRHHMVPRKRGDRLTPTQDRLAYPLLSPHGQAEKVMDIIVGSVFDHLYLFF